MGCQSAERLPYGHDPLLASKRPAHGLEGRELPAAVALAEPCPPVLPESAYASLPPAYRIGIAPLEPLAPAAPRLYANSKTETPPAPKPVTASLVSRVKTPSGPAAIPASRQKQSVRFSHAADFSWVEGVIELSELGQWRLRYAGPKVDDPWHGCVMLESNRRLGGLHEGSIVRVEGEIISAPGDRWPVSVYRIRRVSVLR